MDMADEKEEIERKLKGLGLIRIGEERVYETGKVVLVENNREKLRGK
jgi:hypothetical protein